MHRVRFLPFYAVAILASTLALPAQTFVWSGQGNNGNSADPANWQGGSAPAGTGLEDLVFGDITGNQNVAEIVTSAFHTITFNGSARPEYSFTGSDTTLTLTGNVSANMGSPNNSPISFNNNLDIVLSDAISATHTINIEQTVLHVLGDIGETGAAALVVKTGSGSLYLSGNNSYTGGTIINSGTVIAASHNALGTGETVVNSGSTLQLNSATLTNTLTFNSGSRLTGSGQIANTTIGNGVTIAPGIGHSGSSAIDSMYFEDLTIGGNSTFEMHVRYDSEGGYASDEIYVYNSATLTIDATDANPFTLRLISLNSDYTPSELGGSLLLGQSYYLYFLNTNGVSGDFTLGQNLVLDTSNFDTGGVDVAFELIRVGNNYQLTFTPVPEPSTYALLAVGLGFIGVTVWRRRRAT